MENYYDKIEDYYSTHEKQETADNFGLTLETLNRYLRTVRQRNEAKNDPDMIIDFPKILIVDIETSPIKAFTWGLWKQNIQPRQIIQDWFMIGWAAKWLFEDEVHSGYVTPKEAKEGIDKSIQKELWHLLDKADMVIAHNAKKFDVPRIDTRLFLNGHNPPSPYQVIDTLYYYRKQFAISSNKLDYINQIMLIPGKVETGGFQLWVDCLDGKQEALDKMEEYNINDVKILEENYLRVRPWIKNHPNVAVYMNNGVATCSVCGGTKLKPATTDYGTPVNRYQTYRCITCGAIAGRDRKSLLNVDDKKNMIRGIAR